MSKSFLFKQLSIWALLLMLLPFMLYGCFPAVYTYWAPTAPGGKLFYGAAATGSIAPGNTIEFSYDGVQIQLSGNGNEVGITLRISRERSVSFSTNEVELHEERLPGLTKIQFDATSIDASTMKWLHFSPTDNLTGDFYAIDIMFSGPEKAQYAIKLPPIKINDQIYKIPEIKFTKKEAFGVFGF